jgi:hypothetical protein
MRQRGRDQCERPDQVRPACGECNRRRSAHRVPEQVDRLIDLTLQQFDQYVDLLVDPRGTRQRRPPEAREVRGDPADRVVEQQAQGRPVQRRPPEAVDEQGRRKFRGRAGGVPDVQIHTRERHPPRRPFLRSQRRATAGYSRVTLHRTHGRTPLPERLHP